MTRCFSRLLTRLNVRAAIGTTIEAGNDWMHLTTVIPLPRSFFFTRWRITFLTRQFRSRLTDGNLESARRYSKYLVIYALRFFTSEEIK